MKKTLLKFLGFWIVTIIVSLFIQSCSDDESYDVIGDTQNKVYINNYMWSPTNAPDNSFLFSIISTPVGTKGEVSVKFPVKCTKMASNDVNVHLEVDNSLVVDGYSTLPDNVKMTVEANELIIAKGNMISGDSISISIAADQLDLLEINESYMVPVKISSVSGAESGSNLTAVYLIVNTSFSNCVNQPESVSGTVADRTGWTATSNGADVGNVLFDDDSWTYVYDSNYTLEIDLGAVSSNVKGFKMNFYNSSYAIGSANIYTRSTNTDEYELQGSPSFLNASEQFVEFYEAVNARYIKIEITGSYSGWVAMTEFNMIN